MNTIQRITKNTGVLLASQIASYILGFFFIMYTARYLGAGGFGILSFALAFTGIFSVFSDLGLNTLSVREVARDKSLASKYLGNVAVMKIILVIISFGLIALTINLLGYPEQTIRVVYLVALSVIFNAFTGMFNSIFQAFEKMEYQSVGHILSSVLMLSGALFAISQDFSVTGFASLYFLVSAIVLGYSFVICAWKFVLPKMEVDFSFWKPTTKEALPFGLSIICISIYYYLDSVILSIMKGDIVVGWYSAAYRIMLLTGTMTGIYYTSIFPTLSKLFNDGSFDNLKKLMKYSLKFLGIVSLVITVLITIFSKDIINLIFGNQYSNSALILQILIWNMVVINISSIYGHTLNACNRQEKWMRGVGAGAIFNMIGNILLIPPFGMIGAAVTTILSEVIVFIFVFHYTLPNLKINFVRILSKPAFCSLLTFVALFYFNETHIFLRVTLGLIFFCSLLLLTKSITRIELKYLSTELTTFVGGNKKCP